MSNEYNVDVVTFLQVTEGGELTAIRELCKGVIDRHEIFGDFSVQYTSSNSNYTLCERATIDAGGLTDRLLTQSWSIIFNSSGVCYFCTPIGVRHVIEANIIIMLILDK